MARILAAAFSFLAGLLPLCAVALGLGDIDLKSALQEPFRAEIPVSSEATEDLKQVKVTLASSETFERYGLERPLFITDFEFSVEPEGLIRISSRNPVIEPFVTLLIDVKWPQGRLLREYTVLLDPPVFTSKPVEQAAPSQRRAAQPRSAPPAPPTPQVVAPPASTRSSTVVPTGSSSLARMSSGETWRVQRNETLWGIAGRMRPDSSVDVNQMMLAIYRANPEAFFGNINRLKAGAILRVPNADELVALNRRDAMQEVQQQNQSWSGSAGTESPRLRLVPPDEDGDSALPSRTGGTGTALADSAETDRLTRQVGTLESELEESRRLLDLRDNELRDLQNQLAGIDDEQSGAQEVLPLPADELAAENEAADDIDIPAAEDVAEIPADADADADTPAAVEDQETIAEEGPAADRGRNVTTVSTTSSEPSWFVSLLTNGWLYLALAVTLVSVLLLRVAQRRGSGADDDTGHWQALDEDDGDTIDPGAHEATARMRAAVPDESILVEESPPAEATADDIDVSIDQEHTSTEVLPEDATPTEAVDIIDSGDIADSIDEELPFERTISSDAALDLDTADPVAEADFHMAYGLYDQAADLLNTALGSEPDRQDLRLKLLEVYFIWENKDGFITQAQAYADSVDIESDAEWNKVLIMGQQICPDESLFSGTPDAPAMDDAVDLAFSEDDDAAGIMDFALDDDGGESSVDVDLTGERMALSDENGDEQDDGSLDFDIGDDAEGADDSGGTVDLDLDVGASDAPTTEMPTVESEAHDSPTMESPTIETAGSDSPTMETPTIESPSIDATAESPTIETPAADLDMDIGELPDENAGDLSEPTAELELDDLGLDIDGLDDAADDLTAGLESLDDEDATLLARSEDMGGDSDETLLASSDVEEIAALDSDVTAEVEAIDVGDEEPLDLDELTSALEKSSADEEPGGDTVEQPAVDETAEQPKLNIEGDDPTDLDVDVGEEFADESGPTENLEESGDRPPDGPTMTEVGTKLDLARAYVDMGDPDGARSILNEVLEEGADEQKQEAQKLLDDLG